MRRLFLYIKYYFEPNDRMLSKLAHKSAMEYFASKKLSRHVDAKYARMEAVQAYKRGFKSTYRSNYAKAKLNAK